MSYTNDRLLRAARNAAAKVGDGYEVIDFVCDVQGVCDMYGWPRPSVRTIAAAWDAVYENVPARYFRPGFRLA